MEDYPLVSAVTPVLNGRRYLEECVQSVLNQSYPHVEQIFVDGGSTDGTSETLLTYQSRFRDRIQLIFDPGTNAREAWNKGWEVARGDILCWLGCDDRYEPDAVRTVVEFFRTHPSAYFVYGGCNYIDEHGRVIRKYPVRDFDLDEAINHECSIPATSAFYRKELVHAVGPLDTSINLCDRDYWIRAGKLYKIHRIEPMLSGFRLHEGGITWSRGHKIYAREHFIISQRYGARFFSLYKMMYYASLIVEFLRPVLGPIYPYLRPFVLEKIYPFYRQVLYPSLIGLSRIVSWRRRTDQTTGSQRSAS